MAKTKVTKKVVKTQKKKNGSRKGSGDLVAIARHLADPCHSDLGESYLMGQKGIVSRFSTVIGAGLTGTNTELFFVYQPASNTYGFAQSAGNVPVTMLPTNNGGPGWRFFEPSPDNQLVGQFRVLGACLEVWNPASLMDQAGSVYFCNGPALDFTGALNFHTFTSKAQTVDKFRGQTLEYKWRPGFLDDTYSVPLNLDEDMDPTDRNVMALCIRGPVDTQVEIKVTMIAEWVPDRTVDGINIPVGGHSGPQYRISEGVRHLDNMSHDWWYKTKDLALSALGMAGKTVLQYISKQF